MDHPGRSGSASRGAWALLVTAGVCLASQTAHAQSAADKATARQVATEGIELYQKGDYVEALDRLKRAQALYDAPPHLLYIARCQVKLEQPQLVEAAENYRLVVNKELESGAPEAFKRAREEAQKEFDALEPRIPSLQIDVTPEGTADLALTIDGAPVASAVIGIARPVNPGEHAVAVSAPGFERAEKTVTVAEGESIELALALTRAEGGAAPAPSGAEDDAGEASAGAADKPGLFGFMVGLRLGAAVPGGAIGTFAGEPERPMSDLFKAGGAAELHGGVRFARFVTAALFGEVAVPTGGSNVPLGNQADAFENSATARTFGVKVMVGTPRNRLGGFGEIGFAQQVFELSSSEVGTRCSVKTTLSGTVLRLGGGAIFPIGQWIHVVPFGALAFGTFGNAQVDATGCAAAITAPIGGTGKQDLSGDAGASHTLLMFGVGGDFVFGSDATE